MNSAASILACGISSVTRSEARSTISGSTSRRLAALAPMALMWAPLVSQAFMSTGVAELVAVTTISALGLAGAEVTVDAAGDAASSATACSANEKPASSSEPAINGIARIVRVDLIPQG